MRVIFLAFVCQFGYNFIQFMQESQNQNKSSIELAQVKSEWALINEYKAMQIQREKNAKRSKHRQQQKIFREYLDKQVQGKKELLNMEKQKQNKYYEQVLKNDQQLRKKQVDKRNRSIEKYKNLAQNNKQLLQVGKSSRMSERSNSSEQGFSFAAVTIENQKQKKKQNRRIMVDSLDMQLQIKAEERARERQKSKQLDEANLRYQMNQLSDREKNPKIFGQNEVVYDQYMEIKKEREMKERQIDEMLIDRAREEKNRKQIIKLEQKKKEKALKNEHVKEYLDIQVENHSQRVSQAKKVKPSDYSYSLLDNLFRQKRSPYDKKQYYEYLKHQKDEKMKRKQKEIYMSDEEYKLNMNQLNKVISGEYAHKNYVDRSVSAVGSDQNIKDGLMLANTNDSERVKMKLGSLKEKGNHGVEKSQNQD